MSGICGIISRELGEPEVRSLIGSMVSRLPLRPQEGKCDTLQGKWGAFGVYRQFPGPDLESDPSLIEGAVLSLAWTGELYNRRELRQLLSGQFPPDLSDAALLADLYRQYGIDFLSRLRGVYALALWDGSSQRFLLTTDRLGTQPLYYHSNGKTVSFGSRLNAILQVPSVPRETNLNSIYQYVFFSCIPTPDTIYEGIRRLPSGHCLVVDAAGSREQEYWAMRFVENGSHSAQHYATGIRRRLEEAVRIQATYRGREERVGSFLSGGTDSSTISGILGQVSGGPARTFSIGFSEKGFNEIEYAHIAARHFQTQHSEYFVTPQDTFDLIPKLVEAYDQPFGNASAVPTYYCARLAQQQGIQVMLAGDGGDELFGGNTRYTHDKLLELYQQLPGWLRQSVFEPVLFGLPWPEVALFKKARKYVRRSNIPQPSRYYSYNLLHTVQPDEIFGPDFLKAVAAESPLRLAQKYYDQAGSTSLLNRLLNIDLKTIITDNDLCKVTPMCELAGVGVRYPMLDSELVEFSATVPAGLKIKGFRKRYIFKEAFKNFLPPEILAKKKHGFGLPISLWLRGVPALGELARDTLLSQASLQRGYFSPNFLKRLFQLHRGDTTSFFGDNLWVLLMLELWHQSRA